MKSTSPSDSLPFGILFRTTGLSGRLALLMSSWFCVGLLPRAPGTFGTLAAVPMVFLVHAAGAWAGGAFVLFFIGLAIWASGVAERLLERKDPPEIVSDEVSGFMVTLYLLPFSWFYVAGGFILFRILDIIKVYPIRKIERIPGGAGIILDDVLAGIIANVLLRSAGLILGAF